MTSIEVAGKAPMEDILKLLEENRVLLGRKPVAAAVARAGEVRRLTGLFKNRRGFSFLRLGDYDLIYLLSAENGGRTDLFSSENTISGTTGGGTPGLEKEQARRLRDALEQADYVDFWDCQWKDDTMLDRLALRRAPGTTRNPSRDTSYILPTWLEQDFKTYCENRRVLFCGAEAPLLEELLKHEEFRGSSADFWPQRCEAFFLRPREDGRNLAGNLDFIKQDLAACVSRLNIDTLFLSLGGGAKILCHELARELGICAIDFGALLRSLTYSGSDGNRATRSTHTVFLFRVPFGLHMDALERAYPNLNPEQKLAKAHAQLLLEVQEKEAGWSHASWEYDFSPDNMAKFQEAFAEYKQRYRHLFRHSAVTRKERKDFTHFCGTHQLTGEGRLFLHWFNFKGWIKNKLPLPS